MAFDFETQLRDSQLIRRLLQMTANLQDVPSFGAQQEGVSHSH